MRTYKIIDVELNSDKWKEFRRDYVGASDAPAIMGVSPWKTPLQLWEEKMENKESEVTEAMARGTMMEPFTRAKINEKIRTNYSPVCVQSIRHAWMIATLDGWDEEAIIRGCEIKNPGRETHQMARERKVPEHYFPQLQHQMVVTDQKEWLYVSEYQDEVVEIVVKRDDEYCDRLIQEEERFYHSLLEFKPPAPSEKDYIQINDQTAIVLSRSYAKIAQQLEELEKQKEEIRKTLIESAKHPRMIIGELVMTKFPVEGTVKYENIPELSCYLDNKTGKLDKDKLKRFRGPYREQWRIS